MRSSDGNTRSLVSDIEGQGWDYAITRHPYHEFERPLGPHYCVYNRRLMVVCFDKSNEAEEYWRLRRTVGVLHTGELPLEFSGPDAERLVDKLFTKDMTRLKIGRCGYGLACFEDGGMITDGVVLRLAEDRFWYAQADGDFYAWARAHGAGMNVKVSDPDVFVSQVQGPNALRVLEAAADDGMPDPFGYFAIARVKFGGQEVIVTRTGYTNELGWEFYTEPHHDAAALWHHIEAVGAPFGIGMASLDAMNIRRIEAGIQNAGSDFDQTTTPYDVGLGRFVDDKADFIGKDALAAASGNGLRLFGVSCAGGVPRIAGHVQRGDKRIGHVTAGAYSPFLETGVGIVRLDSAGGADGDTVTVACTDGALRPACLVTTPFYDKTAEIPRGKRVDIPTPGGGSST